MKASDILESEYDHEGDVFIRAKFNKKNQFKTEEEARNLLELWDSAKDLKAENERLKDELQKAHIFMAELTENQ